MPHKNNKEKKELWNILSIFRSIGGICGVGCLIAFIFIFLVYFNSFSSFWGLSYYSRLRQKFKIGALVGDVNPKGKLIRGFKFFNKTDIPKSDSKS